MKYQVLVDIHSIIDIRMNLIEHLNPDIIDNDYRTKYANRQSDNFTNVPVKVYELLLSYGNKVGLRKPTLTKVFDVISDGFFKQKEANIRTGTDTEVLYTLSVNVYPYYLTDIEKNTLIRGIRLKIPDFVDVNIIDKPYDEKLINKHDVLYLYESVKIISKIVTINENFKHNGDMYAPALILNNMNFKTDVINKLLDDMRDVYSIFTNISFMNQDIYIEEEKNNEE